MGKYKKREYVEDSTRGHARIDPRKYKGDSLVQVWLDRRKLAMLSMWLDGGGYKTRYLSEVIRFTIDEVVAGLLEKGIVEEIQLTSDADQIIQGKYRVDLNPGGKGLRNLHHNLVLDERRREKEIYYRDDIDRPINRDSTYAQGRRETAALVDKWKELEANGTFAKKEAEERTKDIDEQKKRAIEAARKSGQLVEPHYGKKELKGGIVIDVDENLRKMQEADEKLKDF